MPRLGDKRNPELEAAILADPYDSEAYSVYADWLQGEGDLRGELIALQIAGDDNAAARLIERHADLLLGELAAHQEAVEYAQPVAVYTWRYGFLHAAQLSHFTDSLAEILEALLRHPSARFLAELTLVSYGDDDDEDEGNGDALQALLDMLAMQAPSSLRKLRLAGDFGSREVGNAGALWARLSGLTTLIVEGELGMLGAIALPDLRSAAFALSESNARAIASASWPRLTELELWGAYDEDRDATDEVACVQALLADLPALTKLGLKNTQFTDALCDVLPGIERVGQLTELDLSLGCMTDDGARALATGKAALGRLAVLNVSENYLTSEGLTVLQGAAERVIGDRQRKDGDPEGRRPAAEVW